MAGSRPYRYGRPASYGRPAGFGRPHDGFGRPVSVPSSGTVYPTQGKTPLGAWSPTVRVSGSGSVNVGVGTAELSTGSPTTAQVSMPFGVPGYMTDMQNPGLYANTLTGTPRSYSWRADNTTTGLVISTSNTVGTVDPTENVVSQLVFAASQNAVFRTVVNASGGSASIRGGAANFVHTGIGHIGTYAAPGPSFATNSVTRYGRLCGSGGTNTTLAPAEIVITRDSVLVAAYVYVSANARSTNTTLNVLVDGVSVASVVVAGAATGLQTFSLGGGVSLPAGSRLALGVTTLTGGGTITITMQRATVRNDVLAEADIWCGTNLIALGGTAYIPIIGAGSNSATYNATIGYNDQKLLFEAIISTPRVYVSSSSGSVTSTIRLLVNGSATGVVVTIPPAGSGWFEGTGTATVGVNDRLTWEFIGPVSAGGVGSITPTNMGCLVQYIGG